MDFYIDEGHKFKITLEVLLETRMLINSNSGGGKSWCLRKLFEETKGKVQQIIIDPEGEFVTLREKFDYILVGKGGDVPISVKSAEMLARKLLELKADAIIDLYELKKQERIVFVKRFLDAMVDAPKELWHPVLVGIDEIHNYAPEQAKGEAKGSVIELASKGRKRGYCLIGATQRLSKLDKDVAAELNNVFVGRTVLDIDVKRAVDLLGFNNKDQADTLRRMQPGNFYVYGPAVSPEAVSLLKVGMVKTVHPKSGSRTLVDVPPASNAIKNLLGALKDLPKEAEQELRTIQDYQAKINELKLQLRKQQIKPQQQDPAVIDKLKIAAFEAGIKKAKTGYEVTIKELQYKLRIAKRRLDSIKDMALSGDLVIKTVPLVSPVQVAKEPAHKIRHLEAQFGAGPKAVPVMHMQTACNQPVASLSIGSEGSNVGWFRMLQAAAKYYPDKISKAKMATIAGMSPRGGSFGTYLSKLRQMNYINQVGSDYVCTEEGLAAAGNIDCLPQDRQSLVDMWRGIINGGAKRMLEVLNEKYPETITKEDLGIEANVTHTGGSFGTYLSILRRNGLIEVGPEGIRLSKEISGEEQ